MKNRYLLTERNNKDQIIYFVYVWAMSYRGVQNTRAYRALCREKEPGNILRIERG